MIKIWALSLILGFVGCAVSATDDDDLVGADGPVGAEESEAPPESTAIARQICVSRGTNGRLRDRTFQPFVAGDGTRTEYHLYARGPWTSTPGLVVYLHGSGAEDFAHPEWNIEGISAVGRAHDLITLAVRSPAADATWHTDPIHNSAVLSELISRVVLDRFPIDKRRVLLVGYSSGAVFTSAFYLPQHGEDFCGGGSILFGEGRPPWIAALANHTYASTFINRFKLHFYAGQEDPFVGASRAGAAFYADLGFMVTEQHPANIGHLDIPFARVVQQRLDRGFLPPP